MTYQDNRLETIFRCIVEAYIETAVPVGSRAVSKRYEGSLSPASIRNVMADLEEMEFIAHPHTSAGRIPTAKGYRHYVDHLLGDSSEPKAEVPDLHDLLAQSRDIEDVAEKVSRLLADLTHNAGICFLKHVKRVSVLRDIDRDLKSLIQDEVEDHSRLYVDGASHVFEQPEFFDIHRAQNLLRVLELKEALAGFLDRGLDGEDTHVYIGDEIDCGELADVSIVVKKYSLGGRPMGCLAVIGPTRMHYGQTVGIVNHLADSVTHFLNEL